MSEPQRYLNREHSWLEFNRRVLSEAANERHPILERVKYVAIFESNLDEFYMVRVSGLYEQSLATPSAKSPDGKTAIQQLDEVAIRAGELRKACGDLWHQELIPELKKCGIRIVSWASLSTPQKEATHSYFRDVLFNLITSVMLLPAQTFPNISNRSLNLGVILRDADGIRIGRIRVPGVVPRLVPVQGEGLTFVLLEDVLKAYLGEVFVNVEVAGTYMFRVLRDADFEIKELEAGDLFGMVEETMLKRRFGEPVCLEIEQGAPHELEAVLMHNLALEESDVRRVKGPLGLDFCWELANLPEPELRYPPHHPYLDPHLATAADLFATVRETDVLVHHPYDTFSTVENFVASAANDPSVIGIKQTLYRVGAESPIVESLMQAAHAGKQVAVIVELKARFDESNNLAWAKALEQAGAHVSYGVPNLKVHSKLCMVVRHEPDGIRTYVHIGTGNYNPTTARIYTDIGYFTCDQRVTQDVAEIFNFLTGFSKQSSYRRLLVAPFALREHIVDRIEREVAFAKKGVPSRIAFKLNSLVDPEVIDALYDASSAGVQVDLVVRGTCCLRPGVEGLSENIRVHSIVGRFLEHSRVYWFANGDEPEALIGSADMMRRNLDRRTEVLVPLRDPAHVSYLYSCVVEPALRDNVQGWALQPSGEYKRLKPKSKSDAFSSQDFLMKARGLDCDPAE